MLKEEGGYIPPFLSTQFVSSRLAGRIADDRESSLLSSALISRNTERLLMGLLQSSWGCSRWIALICLLWSASILPAVSLMFFSEIIASTFQISSLCSCAAAPTGHLSFSIAENRGQVCFSRRDVTRLKAENAHPEPNRSGTTQTVLYQSLFN